MALANTLDAAEAKTKLSEWLTARLEGATQINVSNVKLPKASGLSAETILFSASWSENGHNISRDLVVRLQPAGEGLFLDYDLEMEFEVLQGLEPTSVTTPNPFKLEKDPSFLGAPFLVMERAEGRAAPDDPPFTVEGWVLELTDEQRRTMSENALAALAELHRQDVKALGLDHIGHGDKSKDGLDRLLDYWNKFATWALTEPQLVIETGLTWLAENKPEELGPTVLSWGDARLGNMLIKDDMSVGAIIDWEMVATGPREIDLAWWLFLLEHHSRGVGAPLPGGFRSREQEIARYEELSGHTVSNLHYFEVLAGVRLSVLIARAAALLKGAGFIPKDSPMALINPASSLLAELLDMPSPSGESDYYIGNR